MYGDAGDDNGCSGNSAGADNCCWGQCLIPHGKRIFAPLTVALSYLVEVPLFYLYCLWP